MNQINKTNDRVAILMCTYNGAKFLEQQLDSFVSQTHKNWFLVVSDDGSTDDTLEILETYKNKKSNNHISIVKGPSKGFVENFFSVTNEAIDKADYYAWSDQDDIWYEDKLQRAIGYLKKIPNEIPAIYCGRTQLVSEDNVDIGPSSLFTKKPSFANALIQNIGGGNTMVFNQAACEILAKTTVDTKLISHDWWAYIIISAAGGHVYYDDEPCLRYRQHASNLIGENRSLEARFARIKMLFKGYLKNYNDINIAALEKNSGLLNKSNYNIFNNFKQARQKILPIRLFLFFKSGVHRQSFLDNMGVLAAVIFNKI